MAAPPFRWASAELSEADASIHAGLQEDGARPSGASSIIFFFIYGASYNDLVTTNLHAGMQFIRKPSIYSLSKYVYTSYCSGIPSPS